LEAPHNGWNAAQMFASPQLHPVKCAVACTIQRVFKQCDKQNLEPCKCGWW